MAIQKITADVISSDAITTASISDSAITAAKLAGTLDLTGKTITVATASSGDNDTSVASTAFVQQEIASLVDSAPGTLNTLNELAAALGDDANFSTTVTNSIATKAPLATPQFTNRVGIGVAAHATAALNITNTTQHIRLNNGSELGAISVLSTGELELWGHGDGESINFRTGSGTGTLVMNVVGTNVGITNTSTLNANLHIGSSAATGDATNPALQIGGASTYRLGMFTTAEGGVIDNANGDDGLQFHTKNAGEAVRITADGNLQMISQTSSFANPGFTYHTNNYLYLRGGSSGLILSDDSGINTIQIIDGSSGYINFETSDGSSRMRINSSGYVGIGTTNPGMILDVDGSSAANDVARFSGPNSGGLTFRNATSNEFIMHTATSDALIFGTSGNNERMRIDNLGHVGIGMTPAAVGSDTVLSIYNSATPRIKLHNSTTGTASGDGGEINMSSSDLIIENREAGNQRFFTNGSEKMRIQSSGTVGIGSTVDRSLGTNITTLVVNGSSGGGLWLSPGDSSAMTSQIYAQANGSVGDLIINNGTGVGSGGILFQTNSSEKMRIASNGDLTVGTSSLGFHFDISTQTFATNFGTGGNLTLAVTNSSGTGVGGEIFLGGNTRGDSLRNVISFRSGSNSEKMRIDASGRTLINTTNASPVNVGNHYFVVELDSSTSGIAVGADGLVDSRRAITFYNDNGTVGSINTSGSSTSYNTSSDYRLKENVVNLDNALDRVAQLQPKRFNFIADETNTLVDGFLAHEVQDIVPEAIHGEKDAVDGEGNPEYQGIDQSKLVPLLTKAIQEQQTIIDDLKSRIETLEG